LKQEEVNNGEIFNDTKKLQVLVACCGSGVEAFQLAEAKKNKVKNNLCLLFQGLCLIWK
jgi:hypothetical protein